MSSPPYRPGLLATRPQNRAPAKTSPLGAGLSEGPLRVIKKLGPKQPGAIKLARQFGPALVCVRHRMAPGGDERVTTVELVVDRTPVRRQTAQLVAIEVGYSEKSLRALIHQAGGQWDPGARVWRLPETVARTLNLLDKAVDR